MKHSFRLPIGAVSVLGAMLAFAQSAGAAPASSAVTTPDAIYWRSASNPNVVQWFARLETTLTPVVPSPPGVERWRASVVLKKPVHPDPATLNPAWAGKVLVPYVLTPAAECTLTRDPSMRFVTQETFARGRDIGAADDAPVCSFTFRLGDANADATLANLRAQASAETLVTRAMHVTVPGTRPIAWADLQTPLAKLLGGSPSPITRGEAMFLVGVVAGENADVAGALSSADPSVRAAFADSALGALFTGGGDRWTLNTAPVVGTYDLPGQESVYDL